jgi:ribosomal protein L16 Arg81 hydroxylase
MYDSHGNALAWILQSTRPDSFIDNYFTKRLLVEHGAEDEARFSRLLLLSEFQGILARLHPTDSTFKHRPSLAHHINLASRDRYMNMAGVLSGYAEGSTVFLEDVERRHPPLHRLCDQLSNDFAALGQRLATCGPACVFLTPANSQALEPHTDPTDLLVLQLAGKKHWRFYGESPAYGAPGRRLRGTPPLSCEVTLKQGAFMYVPRGMIHCAHTSDTYSFAITIQFSPLTWHRLLQDTIASAMQESSQEPHLVAGAYFSNEHLRTSGRRELVRRMRSRADSLELQHPADNYRLRTRADEGKRFESINQIHEITDSTRLTPSGKLHCAIVEDKVTVSVDSRYLTGPPKTMAPTFEALAKRMKAFRVSELFEAGDAATKITLAKRLVLERLHDIA